MKEIAQKQLYEGNCTKCNKMQRSNDIKFVDTICYNCKEILEVEQFRKVHSYLIGSTITEFETSYNEIVGITIKGKNGNIYKLTVESNDSRLYFNIELIKE